MSRQLMTPPDDKAIGRRIQELRKQRGLSQTQLAKILGLNQPRVSQYERGDVRLSGPLVAAFARALKASADEILGLEKLEDNGVLRDRRFLRRIQKIDDLSRRQKEALLKSLDMLLKGAGVA